MAPGLHGQGRVPGGDDPVGESIGALLSRARQEQGWSQLRLAELLCAAAGTATVTRHEISRWEREDRIPSGYWLSWLAVVLELPVEMLETIAARARARVRIGRRLAGASGPAADTRPDRPQARVAALRRADDLVGGADLAAVVRAELRSVTAALSGSSGTGSRRPPEPAELAAFAELAQLATWVFADAGQPQAAVRAFRIGMRAAVGLDDRPLVAHLTGCLAEASAEVGTGDRALRLAAAAHRYAADTPAALRVLILHRVAYTAALCGRSTDGEQALLAAERTGWSPRATADPPWLYWLDEPHLIALTGRCYAALGRPRLARALLAEALATNRLTPRAQALCGAWLALAVATLGDLDSAGEIGAHALLSAVRSGSVRAAARIRVLDAGLRRNPDHPAVRRYAAVAAVATGYLADVLPKVTLVTADAPGAAESANGSATG